MVTKLGDVDLKSLNLKVVNMISLKSNFISARNLVERRKH